MSPEKWLADKIKQSGLKICFIAEKIGMDAKVLSAVINFHRKVKADEFLEICDVIGIDPTSYIAEKKGDGNA